MLSTILVPVDESPRSGRLAACAGQLASATGASVLLLEVIADPVLRTSAEHDLEHASAGLRQKGVHYESLVEPGWPAPTVLRVAAAWQVDLIAMATHVTSDFDRWINGSTTDAVVRGAPCPVLVVPAACEAAEPTAGGYRLLVPLDGSPLAEEALEPAAELARALGAEVFLARVVPHAVPVEDLSDLGGGGEAPRAKAEASAATTYLEATADRLRARGIRVQTYVSTGHAAAGIERAARELDASLLVLASHGRGGLTRFLTGSVATDVMQTASIPVVLVRPKELRETVKLESEASVEALAVRGL